MFLPVQERTENGSSSTQVTEVPNKSGSNVMVGTLPEVDVREVGGVGQGQALRREQDWRAGGQEQGPAKSVRHRSLLVDVTPQSRGEKQRAHRGGRDGGPQPSPQAATGSEAVTRMLAAVGRQGDRVGDARETFLCVSQRSQKYDGPYLGR